jgi:hypothetical protein
MAQSLGAKATVTCPYCGFSKRETMPLDACQFFSSL